MINQLGAGVCAENCALENIRYSLCSPTEGVLLKRLSKERQLLAKPNRTLEVTSAGLGKNLHHFFTFNQYLYTVSLPSNHVSMPLLHPSVPYGNKPWKHGNKGDTE